MQLAKGMGIPIFIVGHVTKEGTVAGPRVLEHMWIRYFILRETDMLLSDSACGKKPFWFYQRDRCV